MTISAQQAAADIHKLQEEFDTAPAAKKAAIKAITGLSLIMASGLDSSIKKDALISTLEMYRDLVTYSILNTILDCERDAQAPLAMIIGTMGLTTCESAEKHERRFGTMMELFVDEAEKRGVQS